MTAPTVGQRLVAEAIGTFALVFAGCGAIMVDAKTRALGHVCAANATFASAYLVRPAQEAAA
jgi:glycerol uptake facilitator-like aquaporin